MAESTKLTDLPPDVVTHSLGQFLDARSLIGLSSSCCHHKSIFSVNNFLNRKLWRTLCVERWKSTNFSTDILLDIESRNLSFTATRESYRNPWQGEYKRRHEMDKIAWEIMKEINSSETENITRRRLCSSFALMGLDVLDVLRAKKNSLAWHNEEIPNYLEECLFRINICDQFRCIQKIGGIQDEDRKVFTEEEISENDVSLEYGAVLISRYCCPDLFQFSRDKENASSMDSYIEEELNTLANILVHRLDKRTESTRGDTGSKNYPIDIVLEEMKCFFSSTLHLDYQEEIRPFTGDTEIYYSSSNSMIHEILKNRKGIPITLAIIYSAIVRKAVGVTLDPMGLPGHFMLSTKILNPSSQREELIFVDAFDGGKIVTLPQVQVMICSSYRIPWNSRFLVPVSKSEVWIRMLRNLLNCRDVDRDDEVFVEILMMLGFYVNDDSAKFTQIKQQLASTLCKKIYDCFPLVH